MRRLLPVVCALLLSMAAVAQNKGYGWPMDLKPASFSSTYGELRRNHFHAGLDWRTGGHSGEKLYAIKEGYVCRISVSPVGYGNALYIQHPDGTMSVYGHMDSFRDDIARRVRAEQYKNKSYRVYFEPGEREFPVEKGEFIGFSGNTGSSGGPHLHMEIRTDGDNLPLNYLADGTYTVKDSKPPVISRVGFYAFEDSSAVPVVRRLQMISNPEKYKGTVPVSDKFYVAMDAVDYMEGTTGRLAVERYRVWLDSEKVFDFKVGNVPYSDGRYFACLVQQGESGRDLLKTWCPPNNGLLYKIDAVNDGIICLEDDEPHTLKIVVADCFGNSASCSLKVQRDASIKVYDPADTVGKFAALWYVPSVYSKLGMTVTIPAAALNASTYISCEIMGRSDRSLGLYSHSWRIGSKDIHLQKPLKIRFDLPSDLDVPSDKLYISRSDEDGTAFAGNDHRGNSLEGGGKFGIYTVILDERAPILHPYPNEKLPASGRFHVRAEDSGSGIASYDAQWDGEWILSQLVKGFIQFYPDERHRTGGPHTVRVSATDHCGNTSEVEFKVIY